MTKSKDEVREGKRLRRLVVAGGGTGGHLFPGIAVVEELRRRSPGLEVTFVGTERGIEARVIPERGERLELLSVTPLKGQGPLGLARSLVRLPGAGVEAMSLLGRLDPDLVLGVGGYASGPLLMSAAAKRIPTAILEQNAHVGMTNRLLSKVAGRAYVAFEEARSQLGGRARLLGNPVRRAFVDAAKLALSDPDGFEARSRNLFVLGGSQGARALNQVVPEAIAALDPSRYGLRVLHQTGPAMRDEVEARYRELGVDAEVVSFLDDMARAYASAALIVARAGATTLAELCAIGRPAILVPYPHAADDHQAKNARALERAGAARCILEKELDAEGLRQALEGLLEDPAARRAMAEASRRHGRPDAAAEIVDDLFQWLGLEEDPPEQAEDGGPPSGSGGGAPRKGPARFSSVDFRAGRSLSLARASGAAVPEVRLTALRAGALPGLPSLKGLKGFKGEAIG